jgi:YndJ-like protein
LSDHAEVNDFTTGDPEESAVGTSTLVPRSHTTEVTRGTTGYFKTNFKTKTNGGGQECPPQMSYLWAAGSACVGAAVWAALAVLARVGVARIGGIELMFLFAPLVIVPLGMELGRVMGSSIWAERAARRLQPVGAAAAVVAMLLPPGRWAGWAALEWMIVCGLMGWSGVVGLGRSIFQRRAAEASAATRVVLALGRIDLAVGGAWLVASRLGMRPMGIQEPIGLLTAVHFHYSGFATATIAAATLAFAERRGRQSWLKSLVVMVAGLPFLVAAGFVISPALKMGAAVLFAASVAVFAVFLRIVGRRADDGTARVLLQISSGAVFAGMILAGTYAVADFLGSDALTIPQMVRTHGILNAMGFCLPGLLGWLVEGSGQ